MKRRQSAILLAAAAVLLGLCATAVASPAAKVIEAKCTVLYAAQGQYLSSCPLSRPDTMTVKVIYAGLTDIVWHTRCGKKQIARDIFSPGSPTEVTTARLPVNPSKNRDIYRLMHRSAKCEVLIEASTANAHPFIGLGVTYTQRPGAATA